MPRRIERYAKRLGIYLWPSVDADALVLEIASAIPSRERPQDILRKAILIGLRELAARGEIPEKVLASNRIRERLALHLPAAFIAPVPQHLPLPVPQPVRTPAYAPDPVPAAEPAPMAFEPAPMEFEEVEDAQPDIEAMLRLMGGDGPMLSQDA